MGTDKGMRLIGSAYQFILMEPTKIPSDLACLNFLRITSLYDKIYKMS